MPQVMHNGEVEYLHWSAITSFINVGVYITQYLFELVDTLEVLNLGEIRR